MNISDQIKCVERELNMRRRVYPSWVERERMTQQKADYEISAMEAVLSTLKDVAENQEFRLE